MKKNSYKKRFIAGAICPQCNETDKIFTFIEGVDDTEKKWRACASCEFEQVLTESLDSNEELDTRVNRLRVGEQPLAHEVAVEEIRFIDPKKN